MGRTREMRYRLQPADKSKVIGPSGILPGSTSESSASSRYAATYVHMYQNRVRDAHTPVYVLLAPPSLCASCECDACMCRGGGGEEARTTVTA